MGFARGLCSAPISEVRHALEAGAVGLHSVIDARFNSIDPEGNEVVELIDEDDAGPDEDLAEVLPRAPGVKYELVNQLLTKKAISKHDRCGLSPAAVRRRP